MLEYAFSIRGRIRSKHTTKLNREMNTMDIRYIHILYEIADSL